MPIPAGVWSSSSSSSFFFLALAEAAILVLVMNAVAFFRSALVCLQPKSYVHIAYKLQLVDEHITILCIFILS